MQIIFKKKTSTDTDRIYDIAEGSTITENYNETLDSANIRLSHITEHLDIEPFDKVILRAEDGRMEDRYMCVDTYTETMESLDPYIYSYEISLFSETKELENYVLPNLSITKLKNGTHRKVKDYLIDFLQLYGPKFRVNDGTFNHLFIYVNNGNYPEFNKKFNIDCPEMQWNNPTLREVITDLMMVSDCIPVKRNDNIGFLDLTQKKNAVDTTKVNYIQRSQSSEDYVSELRMDMLNVMQTSLNDIKTTCDTTEYLTWTVDGNSEIVIDTDNFVLKTQFPILNIKHLWMITEVVAGNLSASSNFIPEQFFKTTMKIDLCNFGGYSFVYENQEYQCLSYERISDISGKTLSFLSQNSNYCIYFTRGTNVINGFTDVLKKSDWFNRSTQTYTMLRKLVQRCEKGNLNIPDVLGREWDRIRTSSDTDSESGYSWFSTFFQIEYETTTDAVFQAGKMLPVTHDRIITDNQTNAYVDAYNQGFMEYQKANRLGNQQLHINARYENDYSNILKIGDYYEDSIVFQTQYQIYKNHIEVNASATKDYILRDYFTGVKARIRSWKIADASQALTRHDLNKYYLEFSFNDKDEYHINGLNLDTNDFLSPFYNCEIEPIKYCGLYVTTAHSGTLPSAGNGERYSLDTIGRIMGNSIVYHFGFEDNYYVSKQVKNSFNIMMPSYIGYNLLGDVDTFFPFRLKNGSGEDIYGGIPLQPVAYGDNNAEFAAIVYSFYPEMTQNGVEISQISDWTNQQEQNFFMSCLKKPIMNVSDFRGSYHFADDKMILKDNREIFKLSTQFEFCTDTYDIMFTKHFLEKQKCLSTKVRTENYSQIVSSAYLSWHLVEGTTNIYYATTNVTTVGLQRNIVSFNATPSLKIDTGGNYLEGAVTRVDSKTLQVVLSIQADNLSTVNITVAVEGTAETIEKPIEIYRLPSEQYNFKNTNPDITGLSPVGYRWNINITTLDSNTSKMTLENLILNDGETVENSAFYIYVDGELCLMINKHDTVYLNLLRFRNCNIYDEHHVPVDTIVQEED